jgi:hypothetical protein
MFHAIPLNSIILFPKNFHIGFGDHIAFYITVPVALPRVKCGRCVKLTNDFHMLFRIR